MKCYFCAAEVSDDDYCYGCKEYVCAECDVMSINMPWGGHGVDLHAEEALDEDEEQD